MPTLSISDHYFGFKPATSHMKTCRLAGTNMWETTVLRSKYGPLPRNDDEPPRHGQQITIRMLCRDCGVVHIETGEHYSSQTSHVDNLGYGTKPQRAAGLWLHAGAPPPWGFGDRTPECYYLTGSPELPADPDHVIGAVGWQRGKRGGVVWWAAHGLYQSEYGIYSKTRAETQFKSRAAAAKWVAAQHAQALAEVGS